MVHSNPEEAAFPTPDAESLVAGHEPCAYFRRQYGNATPQELPEIIELATNTPAFQDLARHALTEALEDVQWLPPRDDPRTPSLRVYESLVQCGGCMLARICPIKAELEETIDQEQELEQQAMFDAAPAWLVRARLHQAHLSTNDLRTIMESDEALDKALQNGLSFTMLNGAIHNRQLPSLIKTELPRELTANLVGLQHQQTFETHEIDFPEYRCAFAVTDLSAINGYTGIKPNEHAFGTLIGKLIQAMQEPGPNGRPLILEATQQRAVRWFDGGYVAEIRMGTPERLYAAVCVAVIETHSASGKPMHRLLILGSHDDSAQAEQLFYDQTGLAKLRGR